MVGYQQRREATPEACVGREPSKHVASETERLSSPDGAGSERVLREHGWNIETRQTRRGAPVGVQRLVRRFLLLR